MLLGAWMSCFGFHSKVENRQKLLRWILPLHLTTAFHDIFEPPLECYQMDVTKCYQKLDVTKCYQIGLDVINIECYQILSVLELPEGSFSSSRGFLQHSWRPPPNCLFVQWYQCTWKYVIKAKKGLCPDGPNGPKGDKRRGRRKWCQEKWRRICGYFGLHCSQVDICRGLQA